MKTYHIGLDFGTHQTKACIYDLQSDTHEFFRFPSNGKFFLPSRVALKPDLTFEYGEPGNLTYEKEYYYFKIASAEDQEFHLETFETELRKRNVLYDAKDYYPYTPELLSVLYLTYVLFTIKETYQRGGSPDKGESFADSLFDTTPIHDSVRFTVQIGIPTEWSQKKNLRRKRKFENILLISEHLQQHFVTSENFLLAKPDELKEVIQKICRSHVYENINHFSYALNLYGLSVFPETGAGLTFIINTKQLLPGFYAIMDIGGGSTDISFFAVEKNKSIRYLASESYIVAANDVYKKYAKSGGSVAKMHQAELEVKECIAGGMWTDNENLVNALAEIDTQLSGLVYKLFHKRVYHFKPGMVANYEDQPLLLYGGGSKLPYLDSGRVTIHDNGIRVYSMHIPCTRIEKVQIDRYTTIVNLLPADGCWKSDMCMLVVALGLSFIKPDSFTDWSGEDGYVIDDGRPKFKVPKWSDSTANVSPHPFNEDCFIYDVLAARWK